MLVGAILDPVGLWHISTVASVGVGLLRTPCTVQSRWSLPCSITVGNTEAEFDDVIRAVQRQVWRPNETKSLLQNGHFVPNANPNNPITTRKYNHRSVLRIVTFEIMNLLMIIMDNYTDYYEFQRSFVGAVSDRLVRSALSC